MSSATASAAAGRLMEFRKRLAAARLRLAYVVPAAETERQALDGQHELNEIDAAEARLDAGSYGVCEGCDLPIPLARLRAMPAGRRCAACQGSPNVAPRQS
jgi:hypothetical protein